jgi:opacity protein-like surface antigen
MKKSFTTFMIVLMVFTGPLMAQKQLYFGLAGAGFSSFITHQNNYGLPFKMDYSLTFGGSGNVNIGFDFSDQFGLKLEIGFAKLGQNYKDTYNNDLYSRNIKLNYMQFPLLFKYRVGSEDVKFYAMAGPQLNYLLSASQKYLKNEANYDETVPGNWEKPVLIGESTITDRYNSLDVMVRVDFGVDIQVATNLFLNAGITTAYGLLDINATDWQQFDGYTPSHNLYGGINFGINYTLPIGSK